MPHQHSPSGPTERPTTPTTPTRGPLVDILNITQQITPRKTPRRCAQLRADIQARANDANEERRAMTRRIADLENQDRSFQRPQKRRKRNNRAVDADDSIPNPVTLEARCRCAGRHFVIEEALFLVDTQLIWTVDLDDAFNANNEFADEKSRVQGQLRDVIGLLLTRGHTMKCGARKFNANPTQIYYLPNNY
ncbi:hypothetical protein DFH09DRAFT_1104455 [Mycena vulgaris]|nr:hypothetical protein DFH09DRAFT_1104455 [Mycena vulgaris]